jgi:hypothetical protein
VPARLRQLLTRHGWLVAIAITYLYAFPYFPRIHSANELPRVYLVKAIVHDGTFAIDSGVRRWGATADVSPHAGRQYSNKAPGSSFLVVPVYAAVAAVAGEPSLSQSLWICRVVGGILPALLFLALLARFLARFVAESTARLVVVAYALGSMAMTYAVLYYSHQLAAVCMASAWILATDVVERRRGNLTAFALGVLAGSAVLVDYQAAFAGIPVAAYLVVQLVRTRPLRETAIALVVAAAGTAIPIAALLAYHSACFGSPLRTGYDASQTFAHLHQQGFLGISELRGEAFWGSLFAADNGLLVLSPWLGLMLPGAYLLWRGPTASTVAAGAEARNLRSRDRAAVLVGLAVATIFVVFISSITFWRGGWGVGPRYITAMLPFVLPLVAATLGWASTRRHGWLFVGIACGPIVSAVAIYTLTVVTFPYWPDSLRNPLYEVTWRLLTDGAVASNVATTAGVTGLASLLPYVAVVVALLVVSIVRVAGWRALAIACVVGAGILGAFAAVDGTGPHAERAYRNTVYPAVTR